ncbi:hypothetical protein ACQ4M4_27425 [Leptolyngbya sp. AN02str]|uniref:hypothetical protein n=1 Tax=Leptolyngbya sp. AN02str TaxID=3423363 RepID=UPI003D311A34
MSSRQPSGRQTKSSQSANQFHAALTSRPFAQPAPPELLSQPQISMLGSKPLNNISILNPDPNPRFPIQPKLTIGAAGDKYEQEADRVAQQVVQRLNFSDGEQSKPNQLLQRNIEPTNELQTNPSRQWIIQRQWIPSDGTDSKEKLMQWDTKIDNKIWFCVEGKDLLFYRDIENAFESEKKPYIQWLKDGWQGLTDSALARDAKRTVEGGINPRPETQEESYTKMLNEGRSIFASMKPKEKLSGLNEQWKDYKTDPIEVAAEINPRTKDWEQKAVVKTGYKDKYINRLQGPGDGHYQNYFYFPSGTIIASSNYRAKPQEKEPLPNNEVIYHQLIEAAKATEKEPKVKILVRDHVVNKMLQPIIQSIRKEKGKGDIEFTPKDEIFYVLLTTPNVKAGVFLVNDRGHLTGIKTINKLVLLQKGSVEIHFG